MGFIELALIATGVSMDAFAVALCTGVSIKKASANNIFTVGLYFGIFQAVMPLIGYYLGAQFADKITAIDHWIVFILLSLIGSKMIKDSFSKDDCTSEQEASLKFKDMLPLSLATSIDALAIGVSFSFLQVRIVPAVVFIGITTLLLSMGAVKIGNVFGIRFRAKAEFAGGLILVLMGIKILVEHTGLI